MDSAGERFEAIRAALADRNNILTVGPVKIYAQIYLQAPAE